MKKALRIVSIVATSRFWSGYGGFEGVTLIKFITRAMKSIGLLV